LHAKTINCGVLPLGLLVLLPVPLR
jgi:hypothetical protein